MSDIGSLGSRSIQTLDTHQLIDGLKKNVSDKQEGRISNLKGEKVPSHPKEARNEGDQKLPKDNVHLRRFAAVAVGALAALRCIGAVATLGLSELAVRGIRNAVRNSGTQRTSEMSVQVTLPGGKGTVDLDGAILPKRIPQGMTQAELQTAIQAKVDHGHSLMQQISNGTHDGTPCTTKDMTDIMFFLKASAQGQGDVFHEGAFSIPDPGNKIREFLDTCPQAFQRESSHIGAFQGQDGGRHRGIDVHGKSHDIDQCLPNHNKTLLYGSMQANPELEMSENRLFMKMETFGAYLTSPKGGGDEGGPRRLANYHDASAILGHTFSFLATRGKGSAAGTRKERIPDNVKNDYKALSEGAPDNVKDALNQKNPLATSGGIKVMLANVARAKALIQNDPGQAELLKKLGDFETALTARYTTTVDRIGNEVMLSKDRMGI